MLQRSWVSSSMIPRIKAAIFVLFIGSAIAYGFSRSGDLAHPSFRNQANKADAFSVELATFAATNVYEPYNTGVDYDRTIRIQNPDLDFDIICGTHPFVSATSGPRFFIPAQTTFVTNGSYDIWCVAPEGSIGKTINAIGVVEYETND